MRIAKSLMSKIFQRFKNTNSLKKKKGKPIVKRPRFHLVLITLTYNLVNLPGPGAAGLWHMQCPTVSKLGPTRLLELGRQVTLASL